MSKKTLLIGASTKPERTSYAAAHRLKNAGHEVILLGVYDGEVAGIPIQTGYPELEDIDTVTLYVKAPRQQQYYDYILSLKPRRILFNPGAENPELMKLAREQGIEAEEACTLVLLSVGRY